MATLRKACRNCTAAKRKCVIQVPKCTRCAERGLECTYDLEPANAPAEQESLNPTTTGSPGYCIMRTLSFCEPGMDPNICPPGKDDALEAMRIGYGSVPEDVRDGKPAGFVHPKLQLHGGYNHLAAMGEKGAEAISFENLQLLLQIDVKTVPITEALTAHQALLIHLAKFLFLTVEEEQQREAEHHLNTLLEWTQTLLQSAQKRMPQDQMSPWQNWLFGESVRRTIIMSYALSTCFNCYKHGYCSNWLFMESLPFDRRAGLWMAESPQAWLAAAQVRAGEEVGEQLNSCHEWAENLGQSDHNFGGDVFMAVLAYGHNGVTRSQGS